jgi:hypothetical protein
MFQGVHVSGDFSAFGVQPFVAVGVIEMPMAIDQVFNGVGTETGEGFLYSFARSGDASFDEEFAVGACENCDVAARAFQDADIPAKLGDGDFGGGRLFPDDEDGADILGE